MKDADGDSKTELDKPYQRSKGDKFSWIGHTASTLTGAAAIGAVIFTGFQLDATHAQIALAEKGQVTERFGRAVQQLGDTSLDVRLGGLFALERLIKDSPSDQPTAISILSAYVRSHALNATDPKCQSPPPGPLQVANRDMTPATSDVIKADVAAAIAILHRRNRANDSLTLEDLSQTCLVGVDLGFSADLSGTILSGANLAYAGIGNVNLESADLTNVNLEGALIVGTNMSSAILQYANLSNARVWGSNLSNADLSYAKLLDTDFHESEFTEAKFKGTDVSGHVFDGAKNVPPEVLALIPK